MGILQRFWMRDVADHALFVYKDLTMEQAADAQKAMQFHEQFQQLDRLAQDNRFDTNAIRPLIHDFVRFQNELLFMQLTRHMVANDYPAFRDHLVKESQYYLALIDDTKEGPLDNKKALYEIVFWLRQTVEHSLFIMHWSDPYEFMAVKQSEDFANSLMNLLNKARLFVSMTSAQAVPEIPSPTAEQDPPLGSAAIPALTSLIKQCLTLIQGYRDHLIAIRPMIQNVETLGVLTTRFVDHQRREAQYFMAVLNYILSQDKDAFEKEYAAMPFQEQYTNLYL